MASKKIDRSESVKDQKKFIKESLEVISDLETSWLKTRKKLRDLKDQLDSAIVDFHNGLAHGHQLKIHFEGGTEEEVPETPDDNLSTEAKSAQA
jgi:hypothetical protein